MSNPPKRPRQNRTITVDFNSEQTYHQLCQNGPAFIEFVVAFIMSIGFQLKHKCNCPSEKLTRHSHYARLRLDGLTIWRIQCTQCRAVFTVLPHFVLRRKEDESRGCQEGADGNPWWIESRDLCGYRKRVSNVDLPLDLFRWPQPPGQTVVLLPSVVATVFHRR